MRATHRLLRVALLGPVARWLSATPAAVRGEDALPLPIEVWAACRERFAGAAPRRGQANPMLHARWLVIGLAVAF